MSGSQLTPTTGAFDVLKDFVRALVDRMHGRIEASSTSWVLAPKAPSADLHTSRWGHSDGPLRTMVYDGVMFDDF